MVIFEMYEVIYLKMGATDQAGWGHVCINSEMAYVRISFIIFLLVLVTCRNSWLFW